MPKEAVFVVTVNPAPTVPVTVNYATRDGTAKASEGDYTAKSGTLTFAVGETSKEVTVPITEAITGEPTEQFYLDVSWPVGSTNTVGRGTGTATIPGSSTVDVFLERFRWIYDTLKADSSGYFGPPSGTKAKTIPYHARERAIIVEAPDWTHESVSETVSFWMKLEAWKTILDKTTTGMTAAWSSIETNFIPDAAYGQPWGDYTYDAPAGYVADAENLEDTPLDLDITRTSGPDPLYLALKNAYNTKAVYLMHWLIDVDGDYGFRNPDGSLTGVFINNFQRGPAEDGLSTITHACYDDFANGGHPTYGWQPLYSQAKPVYPNSVNSAAYSKQWNYSVAPDAESRVIASAYLAATKTTGLNLVQSNTKAKRMADFQRYAFYDKYYQPIGTYDQSGCHYLLSWGCGFGGGIPEDGGTSYWGFRIGNSEVHFGYNCVDVAYACKTGGIYAPKAVGAPAQYAISLNRQLEMIRWLQSPEGPIAGGVTSNWKGRYETPTDGRQTPTFYGMYYTYSPSWQNPPSNNWIGYQAWGLERVAALYVDVSKRSDSESQSLTTQCGVILDHFVKWFVANCTVNTTAGTLSYPMAGRWTSPTAIVGQTATLPTKHGDYEYLPSLKWDSTGDYAAFWSANSVPNPTLHYATSEMGWDPGTAGGFAQLLVEYCQAKKQINGGTLSGTIPGSTVTLESVLQLAKDILEVVWQHKDTYGFGYEGSLAITGLDNVLWIPPEFGTGHMPNGEVLANGQTTFASMRASFYETTAEWQGIRDYLDGETTVEPKITYHRFWNGVDVACAYGMLCRYFGSLASEAEGDGGGGSDDSGGVAPGEWTPPTYSAVSFPGTVAALVGDSITYQNSLYVSPKSNGHFAYYSYGMAGWWNFAMMLGNHPLAMEPGVTENVNGTHSGFNFGIAGSKVADWGRESFTPIPGGATAMGPMYAYRQKKDDINVVTVLGGTNDLAGNATADDVLLNLRKIIYEIAADGKWVFVITIPPRSTDLLTGYTLARQDIIRSRIQTVNDGLRTEFGNANKKANIWLVDPWDDLVGPNGVDPHGLESDRTDPNGASSPGNYRPGEDQTPYFPDGLHPGVHGAYIMGAKLWSVMQAAGIPARASNKVGPFTAGSNLLQNPSFTVTNTPRPTYSKTLGRAIGLGAAKTTGPGYTYGVVPDHWFVYRASNQDQESYSNFGEYTFSALVAEYPDLAAYMAEPTWPNGSLVTSIVTQNGRTGFKLDFNLASGNKNESFIFRTNIPAGQNGPWNNYGYATGTYEPQPTNTLYQAGDKLGGEMDLVVANVKGLHTLRLTINCLSINDTAVGAGDTSTTGAVISALGLAQNVWPPTLIDQNRYPTAGLSMRHKTPIITAPTPNAGERTYAQFQLEVGLDASQTGGASCSITIFDPKVNIFTGSI